MIAAAVVTVALLFGAVLLGVRAYEDWLSMQRPPAARLQDPNRIQPWMTVGFIAHRNGVPVAALAAQLGAPAGANLTLIELAHARGVPVPQEVDAVRQAVAQLRAATPGPAPAAGRPPP